MWKRILFFYILPSMGLQTGRKNNLPSCRETFPELPASYLRHLATFNYTTYNQTIISKFQFGKNFGCFIHWPGNSGSGNQAECTSYPRIRFTSTGRSYGRRLWYCKKIVVHRFCRNHELRQDSCPKCIQYHQCHVRTGCRCANDQQ